MKHKLAIVIPAYKIEFFRETLSSIANQTCKAFRLYIGDDASPDDFWTIIHEFENEIEIIYQRFNDNLGASDLVTHWSRCLDLIQEEEWVWLFSDDDIMDPTCVEKLYEHIDQPVKTDLLHFNMEIIDQHGIIIKDCLAFPERLTISEYFSKRIKFKINSSVVEFIFRKSTYDLEAGFKSYDLAWCSDDATWIKFGKRGISTIVGPKVKWRYSGFNISSNLQDKTIVLRKLYAGIAHIQWTTRYFMEYNIPDTTTAYEKFKWVISGVVLTPALSFKEKYTLIRNVIRELNYTDIKVMAGLYLVYWEVRHNTRLTLLNH